MFPTRSKDKISHTLAYPLKAKAISEAFADVPQALELSLWFSHWQSTAACRKQSLPYAVMSAEYGYFKASQFTPRYMREKGIYQPQWDIRVQPVPVEVKHYVAQLLQGEAFPKIHAWLCAHEEADGKEGFCSFNVFYDEEKDRLEYSQRDTTL